MILEWIGVAGVFSSMGAPVAYVGWRAEQVLKLRKKGIGYHDFDPHIRRDMHGKHEMNWCDLCYKGRKAWIHDKPPKPELAHEYDRWEKLRGLETADIKWRFENDPKWVQVFGGDYDPITFQEIPQSHNGECGGPLDSCPRCNWEAEKRDREAEESRKKRQRLEYQNRAREKDSVSNLEQEEIRGYEEILWNLWDSYASPEDAKEDFEDLRNEIGMLKSYKVRDAVQNREAWKRLYFCLVKTKDYASVWVRREEAWRKEKKANHYY